MRRILTAPIYPIQIEYEDDEYLNISSRYGWQSLRKDIEDKRVPIKIYLKASLSR